MNPRFKVSRAGVDLLKDFEGFRSESARLPDGRWTVGYGHTKSARPGVTISESDATALLQYDLIEVTGAVNDLVFTPMTQNQFDSLVCFAFNIGVDAFRTSTVLRRINEGSMLQAAWSLEMWRKAEFEGQEFVVDALVRRRAAEKALFLTPADGWVAAPSPVLPPRIDDDVCRAIPREKPVDLKASLVGSTATLVREDARAPVAEPAAPVIAAAAAASAVAFAPEPAPEAAREEVFAAPLPHRMADATQALSARLEAMASSVPAGVEARSDLDLPAPPEPVAEPASFEATSVDAAAPALSEPVLFERPVVQSRWLPDPITYPQAEPEHEPMPASADLFQGPIFREQPHDVDFEVADVEPAKLGFAPFLILAFVGLVIFAAAATWAFNARSSGGLVNPITVGVGFALLGVACVGWAVYSLLSKFGEWEE
jgi:lysozyme